MVTSIAYTRTTRRCPMANHTTLTWPRDNYARLMRSGLRLGSRYGLAESAADNYVFGASCTGRRRRSCGGDSGHGRSTRGRSCQSSFAGRRIRRGALRRLGVVRARRGHRWVLEINREPLARAGAAGATLIIDVKVEPEDGGSALWQEVRLEEPLVKALALNSVQFVVTVVQPTRGWLRR